MKKLSISCVSINSCQIRIYFHQLWAKLGSTKTFNLHHLTTNLLIACPIEIFLLSGISFVRSIPWLQCLLHAGDLVEFRFCDVHASALLLSRDKLIDTLTAGKGWRREILPLYGIFHLCLWAYKWRTLNAQRKNRMEVKAPKPIHENVSKWMFAGLNPLLTCNFSQWSPLWYIQ